LDESIARRVDTLRAAALNAAAQVGSAADASTNGSILDASPDSNFDTAHDSDFDAAPEATSPPLLPPHPFSPGDIVCRRLGGLNPSTVQQGGLGTVFSGGTRRVRVCSLATGVIVRRDTSQLTYGDGSARGPPPPWSTHPLPHLGSRLQRGQKGCGNPVKAALFMTAPTEASLTGAAVRIERGNPRHDLLYTDGSSFVFACVTTPPLGRQWVEVDVPVGHVFSSFVVQTGGNTGSSPDAIEVFAGPSAACMAKIKVVYLPMSRALTTILTAAEVFGFDTRIIKFRIVSAYGRLLNCFNFCFSALALMCFRWSRSTTKTSSHHIIL
jgi:hypothetical protein